MTRAEDLTKENIDEINKVEHITDQIEGGVIQPGANVTKVDLKVK